MNSTIARALTRAEIELAGNGFPISESHAAKAIAQKILENAVGLNASADDIRKAMALANKALELTGVNDFSLWSA